MRFARPYTAIILSFLLSVSLGAQQASPPTISAGVVLQQSLAACKSETHKLPMSLSRARPAASPVPTTNPEQSRLKFSPRAPLASISISLLARAANSNQ